MWDFATDVFGTPEHWDETRLQLSKAARRACDEGHPLQLRDEESLLEAIAVYHVLGERRSRNVLTVAG
jgi:hypothetical protein